MAGPGSGRIRLVTAEWPPTMPSQTPQQVQPIDRIESGLDATFAISTALLLLDLKVWACALLTAWLVARLVLQQAIRGGLNRLLLVLALLNAGTWIMERGAKPSDPSDLLVILLAFAAGIHRPLENWQRSFRMLAFCLIPIGLAGLFHHTGQLLQFPGINVNRMSFLLGLLSVLTWGLFRISPRKGERIAWLAATGGCIPLAVMTQSRAALAAPVLAILLSELSLTLHKQWQYNKTLKTKALSLAASLGIVTAVAVTCVRIWYANGEQAQENQLSDSLRFPTAICWAAAPFKHGNPVLGLGHNSAVRKHCDDLPIIRQAKTQEGGLPHAHNVPAQILGETGLAGLAGLSIACVWLARRIIGDLRISLGRNPTGSHRITRVIILPLSIYLLLTGMTTSFEIFLLLNQMLIGYLLASITMTSPNPRQPSPKQMPATAP